MRKPQTIYWGIRYVTDLLGEMPGRGSREQEEWTANSISMQILYGVGKEKK